MCHPYLSRIRLIGCAASMDPFPGSLISTSRQLWKIYTAVTTSFVAAACTLVGVQAMHWSSTWFEVVVFGALLLWCGGLVVPVISVRCPRCSARFVWHQLSALTVEEWFNQRIRHEKMSEVQLARIRRVTRVSDEIRAQYLGLTVLRRALPRRTHRTDSSGCRVEAAC
jgi:hypothetical protein